MWDGGGQPRGQLALGQSVLWAPSSAPGAGLSSLTWTQTLRARTVPPPPMSHLCCTSAGVISNWTDEHRLPPCTIFQAFKYYLDITTPPTPLQLQQFASLATSEKERQRLLVLSKVGPWPHSISPPAPWRILWFPRGSAGKESACNAGDPGSIPGLGRSPGEGNGNPLQDSCLENPMDRGDWQATVHGAAKGRT